MIAIASACVLMTSCKDDDAPRPKVSANVTELAAAEKANPDMVYTYVLDGRTYNNAEELQAALADLEPGSSHNYTVVATDKNDPTNVQRTQVSFTVPTDTPITITFDFPTPQGVVTVTITITVTPATHSGGAIR